MRHLHHTKETRRYADDYGCLTVERCRCGAERRTSTIRYLVAGEMIDSVTQSEWEGGRR